MGHKLVGQAAFLAKRLRGTAGAAGDGGQQTGGLSWNHQTTSKRRRGWGCGRRLSRAERRRDASRMRPHAAPHASPAIQPCQSRLPRHSTLTDRPTQPANWLAVGLRPMNGPARPPPTTASLTLPPTRANWIETTEACMQSQTHTGRQGKKERNKKGRGGATHRVEADAEVLRRRQPLAPRLRVKPALQHKIG